MLRGNVIYLVEAYHVDHVVPLMRGGSNDPDNICLACKPCNLAKGILTGTEFLALLEASEAA